MHNPSISVIIPVFNGERFIAEAIQSVLDQNYEPLEIVVIDDGSKDATAATVKNIPGNIRYFYQENAGVASARNKGLEMAQGELIAFVDADDVWTKNKLALQCQLLQENSSIEIIMGFLLQVKFDSTTSLHSINLKKEKGALATQMGCLLIKKQVFEKIGGFDQEMLLAEDVDWLNRARESQVKILVHKEIVQFYRSHDTNITKDKKATQSYMLKAYKKSLDRRRSSAHNTVLPFAKPENIDDVLKYWQNK